MEMEMKLNITEINTIVEILKNTMFKGADIDNALILINKFKEAQLKIKEQSSNEDK